MIINKYSKYFSYFMIYDTIRYIVSCSDQKKYKKQEFLVKYLHNAS